MWITKEQLEDNKFFYTTVECQIKDVGRCNYEIDFIGYKYISIDSCIFTYNYYVSAKNKKMTFAINNDIGISDTTNQILTLYANGGKKIKLTLGNCLKDTCKQHDFRTGAAITTTIQKHNFFELTVEAEEGDFISVGSKVTLSNGKSYENDLKPNNYQFTGYLKKGVLDRECYSIPDKYDDISYIVGMFYNNAAEIYFNDQNFNEIAGTKETITKGYYSYVHYHKKSPFNLRKYICVRFPDSNNYINENLVYSLQLTQPTEKVGLLNIYGPQLKGNIYPRIIPKGSSVFFTGANLNSNKNMNELLYNMIALEGLPIMYIYKCQNYPKCDFDFDDDDVIKINEINRMSTWHTTFFNNSITPIDAEQYIMIVKCEDLENSATDVCQFQTSIYENEDEIYLIDRQPFSQYITQEEKSKYIIDLTLEKSSTKVHVDIFVLSGDVNFKLKDENNKDIVSHKYYLANKIFHSINLEENRGINKIIVDIEAIINSFYIIEYKLVRGTESELTNDMYTGINYLIPILPSKDANTKRIDIYNIKLLKDDLSFISFYSLNCDFKISRIVNGEEEPISTFVKYSQDIIQNTEGEEVIDKNSYIVTVVETDLSQYKNNMCM